MPEHFAGGDIARILPHRYPFLFIDTLDVIEEGKRARGVKRVTGEECLCDPVSGVPIGWPNLLVLEALAQATAAILVSATDGAVGTIGYFASMEQVKMRDPARPGETLLLDVELLRMRRGLSRVRGVATVGGRLVARATFTVSLRATVSEGRGR